MAQENSEIGAGRRRPRRESPAGGPAAAGVAESIAAEAPQGEPSTRARLMRALGLRELAPDTVLMREALAEIERLRAELKPRNSPPRAVFVTG